MRPLTRCTLALVSLALLAGCSSAPANTPASASSSTAGDPVGYLYDVDEHRHPQADVQALVAKLRERCTDDPLLVAFTATNTAADLVDANHPRQDVYPVVAALAADLPARGKVGCASRLPDAGKALRAAAADR
ncbi:hypothetical protein ABZ883_04935 [Streptomyces sp. NPDC046977]|uniref:hypothetical protein n=1 Tax=Streptomyces sp. NPDC046977 TaxID=3154703 RepID=UPI0033DC9045